MNSVAKEKFDSFIQELPDSEGALRFFESIEKGSSAEQLLADDHGLLTDSLTIAAFSPLLARTLLQHPSYLGWLKRVRVQPKLRSKEEILESLARFSLTHSTLSTGLILSRFRRRELIRIYLKDIRGLGTIAEVTEEISNLADAILEHSLRLATQEMDNRFGTPLETDQKGKSTRAEFCVVALGKLGSKELNYSSDIDLLFLYSAEGETSGNGSRGVATNREYFVKTAEFLTKLIGSDSGEGAAYRVDVRLRPHGSVGRLAITASDATAYYHNEARLWERQVLIRSRLAAGNSKVYEDFYGAVEERVFSKELTVTEALASVKDSKEKIDSEKSQRAGFNVKLGKGGIREIEFIAQALQLAYGGKDRWLRAPHTLIAISRSADRGYIEELELSSLFEAYAFLRRIEHRLQMEHGLQTHTLPDNLEKRLLVAQRMGIFFVADFNTELEKHCGNVRSVFARILGDNVVLPHEQIHDNINLDRTKREDRDLAEIVTSVKKSDEETDLESFPRIKEFSRRAPAFSRLLAANPALVKGLPRRGDVYVEKPLFKRLEKETLEEERFSGRLSRMRRVWSEEICRIAAFEVYGSIDIPKSLSLQTELAEASIDIALEVTRAKLRENYDFEPDDFRLAVLGLGKVGGGGMDFGSDLDLVLVYDDERLPPCEDLTHGEFYAKAAELFMRSLSGMTREGSLYKVDLRLRPDGKNGATTIGKNAFLSYLRLRASIWEWLAYVKLRAVAGPKGFAFELEELARAIIHERAQSTDPTALREESGRIRQKLEQVKSGKKRFDEIDLKYGEGGLQDVYFAVRFLQLRHDIRDAKGSRGTLDSLQKLRDADAIALEDVMRFKLGYSFLRRLDHNLRLYSGRSQKLRTGDIPLIEMMSASMGVSSADQLLSELSGHRLDIKSAYDSVFQLS